MGDRSSLLLLGGLVVVAVLASAVWVVDRWWGVDHDERAERLLDGTADADDFDVSLTGCRDVPVSEATASLTNTGETPTVFRVAVRFSSPRGFTLDVVESPTPLLGPGESAELVLRSSAPGTGEPGTGCRLAAVDRAAQSAAS